MLHFLICKISNAIFRHVDLQSTSILGLCLIIIQKHVMKISIGELAATNPPISDSYSDANLNNY